MDYRDEVFLAVADNLNFSKAAEELFISQPAVTEHIRKLEAKLNVTLFERKGNKVYLTQAGKINYAKLKQIKNQYDELEFELGLLSKTFKGTLRIAASSTISQYLIPEVLSAFYRKYPMVHLYLYSSNSFEVINKLIDGDVDIGMVENYSSNSSVKYIDFLDDELIVVTGKNSIYAKRRNLNLNDLKEIPIVLREKGSGTLEVIRKSLIANQITTDSLNIVLHLGSTEAIKNFLLNFDGIAIVSVRAIEKELRDKSIIKINVKRLDMSRKFRMAFRKGNINKSTQLFVDFMRNYNF